MSSTYFKKKTVCINFSTKICFEVNLIDCRWKNKIATLYFIWVPTFQIKMEHNLWNIQATPSSRLPKSNCSQFDSDKKPSSFAIIKNEGLPTYKTFKCYCKNSSKDFQLLTFGLSKKRFGICFVVLNYAKITIMIVACNHCHKSNQEYSDAYCETKKSEKPKSLGCNFKILSTAAFSNILRKSSRIGLWEQESRRNQC